MIAFPSPLMAIFHDPSRHDKGGEDIEQGQYHFTEQIEIQFFQSMAFVLIGLGKGDRGDDHIKCDEEVGHFFRIDVQRRFHNGEIVDRKKAKPIME